MSYIDADFRAHPRLGERFPLSIKDL